MLSLRSRSATVFVIALLGCAPDDSLDGPSMAPPDERIAEVVTRPGVPASALPQNIRAEEAPTWTQLSELPMNGTPSRTPRIILNSNNPESFDGHGLLFGTVQPSITATGARYSTRRSVNPPESSVVPLRREMSATLSVQGCPAGAFREAAFYAHHINFTGSDARVSLLLSPATSDVRITAWGATVSSASTGFNIDANTALEMTRQLLSGDYNVRVRERAVARGTATELTALVIRQGESFDTRVNINATGCVYARLVAGPAAADVTSLLRLGQERFATGDVQCPQCREAAALGTVAGVFDRDLFASRITVPIGQSLGTFGWRFDSFAQAAQPLAYYHRNNATNYQVPGGGVRPSGGRDSTPVSWANYGADYEVTYDFQNTSNRCVAVKGAFMVYPGTRDPSSVATLPRTMLWNGWALANGVPFQILVNPRRPDRAARTASPLPFACDARNQCTTTARVEANSTQTLRLRIPVPALISAPAGLVFQTAPCS